MRTFLASRAAVTALLLVVIVAATAVGSVARTVGNPTRSGCAELPDSVGMLVGNPVSQFGVRVGTVDSIEPIVGGAADNPNKVRVNFTVDASREFPISVGSVTVADSLVAQRRLELVGTPRQGEPTFPFTSCITNSKTPQSITESLDAISGLIDQFASAGGSAEFQKAISALPGLTKSLSGTGPEVTQLTERLAQLVRDPGPGMGDVGAIIDAFAPAASGLATNWPEVQQRLSTLGTDIRNSIDKVISAGIAFAPGLADLLLTLRAIIVKYGVFIPPVLRIAAPALEIGASQMPKIAAALQLIPALARAITTVPTPAGGNAVQVTYAASDVAVRVADPTRLCQLVNDRQPGTCSVVDGRAQVDPMSATLALAGAGK